VKVIKLILLILSVLTLQLNAAELKGGFEYTKQNQSNAQSVSLEARETVSQNVYIFTEAALKRTDFDLVTHVHSDLYSTTYNLNGIDYEFNLGAAYKINNISLGGSIGLGWSDLEGVTGEYKRDNNQQKYTLISSTTNKYRVDTVSKSVRLTYHFEDCEAYLIGGKKYYDGLGIDSVGVGFKFGF
jgi:hypothetical protein